MEVWSQVYNPPGSAVTSRIMAAIPVVILLVLIASGKIEAYIAAFIALVAALLIAIFVLTMPAGLALRAASFGAVTGFFPIGWIILNVIFDRCPIDRRSFDCDRVVRSRRNHSTLCLLALDRSGLPCRMFCHAARLCAAVHVAGGALTIQAGVEGRSLAPIPWAG